MGNFVYSKAIGAFTVKEHYFSIGSALFCACIWVDLYILHALTYNHIGDFLYFLCTFNSKNQLVNWIVIS